VEGFYDRLRIYLFKEVFVRLRWFLVGNGLVFDFNRWNIFKDGLIRDTCSNCNFDQSMCDLGW